MSPLFEPILAESEAGFWFPPQISTYAAGIDYTYFFITYVGAVFFVLIMGFMAYFCVVYRRRPGHKADPGEAHNNLLETAWSVGPAILLVMMFYWGFTDFMTMRTMPEVGNEISVVGKKWGWTFSYQNGKAIEAGQVAGNGERAIWTDKDKIMDAVPKLHVVINEPIILTMSSLDVLHSFFIPATRSKQDVVPGRYTKMWFQPIQLGTYDIFCTEYCGDKHSEMLAQLVVETQEDFDKWFVIASDILKRNGGDPVKAGEFLYSSRGCSQCHSIDGTDRPGPGGPSFKGHYGETVQFTDGGSAKVDENYIRESILYPQRHIRAGGYGPIMSAGLLTKPEQIDWIIAYIKDLNAVPVAGGGEEGEAAEPAGTAAP